MATIDEQTFYRTRKGAAVIINNNEFEFKSLKPLKGHDKDELNIKPRLEKLKFATETHRNLTRKDTKRILKDAATRDNSGIDCFVTVLLGHGGQNILMCKDETVEISSLIAPFKAAPTLHGKPKIFIIQACRGVTRDTGVLGVEGDSDDKPIVTWLPQEADFLIVYSTVEGYVSWVGDQGSFFISALCHAIDKYILQRDTSLPRMDLMTILTRVNQDVAKQWSSSTDGQDNLKKQIPCIVSRLRKDIFLSDKDESQEKKMEL